MDFPGQRPVPSVISSVGLGGVGIFFTAAAGVNEPTSQTWSSANRALYVPFKIAGPMNVQRLWWANGGTAAGNVDCGVYSIGRTKLASTGSTVQTGTNVVQSVAVSILLQPGSYYMALALSSTSGTVRGRAVNTTYGRLSGMTQQATALPLPASATFATYADSVLPFFGITSSSVI